MDGVLADFAGMKKKMINDIYRDNFLDLVKHINLSQKEQEIFLKELSFHSQDTSLLDIYGKPKISKTAIKRGEGRFWKILNQIKFFEELEPLENNQLIKNINDLKSDYDFKLGILGSTGTEETFHNFKEQKMNWLKKQGLMKFLDSEHIIFVPGKKHKANYANPNSILIDDTPINIENFNKNGGNGILHKNNSQTLKELKEILEKINPHSLPITNS